MIDFPASPTVGQVFTSAGVSWKWDGVKWVANTAGGSSITVSDTPPTGAPGALWWDSTDGQLYVWYDDPSADPGQWVPATNLGSTAVTNTGDVGRNLIHNPLFNIAQRGAGPWTTNGVYTLDRWITQNSATLSVTQAVMSDAQRTQIGDEAAIFALSSAFTGSGVLYAGIAQLIEGVRRLAGKTVTLSFYAAASAALKLAASLDQSFGTGGSPSARVTGTGQVVTLTTSYARYSLTFTLPSAAGKTLGTAGNDFTALNFFYTADPANATLPGLGTQSGTISVWGVQLEIGSVATPLEKPDPADDLRKCQRFYQVIVVSLRFYAPVPAALYGFSPTWATMRATPTAAISGGASANIASVVPPSPQNSNSARWELQATAAGDAYAVGMPCTLSADL